MPVVTSCKSCQEDLPSTLEVASLGTWQSLTVEDHSETCAHCGAVHAYDKAEYRYEDADRPLD
jgi:hypothetical protein